MEVKWGLITSGATFQSLATTLLFFEDSKAALFGRPGPDGGQDARSGDGSRVFQMKHHQNGSAAVAIRDAREEAEKIQTYRQPGHERSEQWQRVRHWRLVTNALFNPNDQQRWNSEVVPLFKAQGFDEVDRWSLEQLEALLTKHPEVYRAYFQGENRAFLSLPEMRERMPMDEPFLRRDALGEFFGRTQEIDSARTFLESNAMFLLVHGSGGIGKTRLLLEIGETFAGEGAWQVLWANVSTMSSSSTWFDGVVRERPTLLLVDEPDDEKLLKVLLEQLGTRTSKWKVVVTVRSPKDPVLRFCFGARMRPRVQELQVSTLAEADALAMCESLLATGTLTRFPTEARREAASKLCEQFARYPVWLTLAVQQLEARGDLAQMATSAKDLADRYLCEIETSQADVAPEVVRNLIRWVALVRKVNREDRELLEQLGKESGVGSAAKVLERLKSLIDRRVLTQRGMNDRLVELKPDVLRDHVLLQWLSTDVGFGTPPIVASEAAQGLIESIQAPLLQGSLDRLGRSKLTALARTEFLLDLDGHHVDILAPLFALIGNAVPTMTASQRVALTEVLESIATVQPLQVVELVRLLRASHANDEHIEGLFGNRIVGHADVIFSLGWLLAHAAMGARTELEKEGVLRELCEVAGAEAQVAAERGCQLPNDGKRSVDLVKRVLEGGPDYWGDFDEVGEKLSLEILSDIAGRSPEKKQLVLLQSLVQQTMAVRRQQTWFDERAIHVRTVFIPPGHPAWLTHKEVLNKVKEVLADEGTPLESRLALWPVFAEVHRELNFGRGSDEDARAGHEVRYAADLLENLKWTLSVLTGRDASVEELSKARAVWDWHREFEKENELREVSIELEEIYASNALAKEFEHLFSHNDWEQRRPRAKAKADELASSASSDDIKAFIDRGARFLGGDARLRELYEVATALGSAAEAHQVVQKFVEGVLSDAEATMRHLEFSLVAAGGWVSHVREELPAQATSLVKRLLEACANDTVRVRLLMEIYGRVPRLPELKDYTDDEHALLRRQGDLFAAQGQSDQYIAAIATTLKHDWPTARQMIQEAVLATSRQVRPAALRGLLHAVYWVVRESEKQDLPDRLGEWLLDQIVLLPRSDTIDSNDEWRLLETLKKTGRPPVQWLPSVLAKRRELEAARGEDETSRSTSHHPTISKYVQPIKEKEETNPGVIDAVKKLLEFVDDKGASGHYLPEVLRNVDPDGLVAPNLVVGVAEQVADVDRLRRLARIGSAYVTGTPAWEAIAKAVLGSPLVQDEDSQRSLFSALGRGGVTSWSGTPGEVPPVFIAEVESTKASLAAASDVGLRRYWAWRVARAESTLREEEQRAKEERGE